MKLMERRVFLQAAAGAIGAAALDFSLPPSVAKAESAEVLRIEDYVDTLTFHEILDPAAFKKQLKGLLITHQPISLESMVKAQRGEIALSKGTRYFHITLDDGRRSQMKTLDIVDEIHKETGIFIPLTFFVTTKFNDPKVPIEDESVSDDTRCFDDRPNEESMPSTEYMTKGDFKKILQRKHRLANHTVNHAQAHIDSFEAWAADYRTGEERIAAFWKMAGREKERLYKEFAFPHGQFTDKILEFLKKEGCDIAFSTGIVTDNPSHRHLTIPRTGQT